MNDNKGIGLLCEVFDHELAAEIESRRSPEEREARAKAMAEIEARDKFVSDAIESRIEEFRKEAEAGEERAACDYIDKTLAPYLRTELEAENAEQRITPEHKKIFSRFKKCCERWE